MQFFAHHGVSKGEAEDGQRFEVDVEMGGDFRSASQSDDLNDAYDYDRIFKIVQNETVNKRYNLVETLAEQIANQLLQAYPEAQVRIVVRKPHLPVSGILESAEVEILRGSITNDNLVS